MDYKIYDLPTERDGLDAVEKKLVELIQTYRGDKLSLDSIELDYMDWANTVIATKMKD